MTIGRTGPTEDEIRSSVLTIRLFLQDKDRISIKDIAAIIAVLPIDHQIKDEYVQYQSELNKFLDSPTSIGFDLGSGSITRGFLFNTFLYGFYAHLDGPKNQLVAEWRDRSFFADMKMEFDRILLQFTQSVARLSRVVQQAEAALAAGGNSGQQSAN